MNINQIYEMIKLRKRFLIILSILGLGFIFQTLYFYSNPNTRTLDINNQGIKRHREIARNKNSVKTTMSTNNVNFTKYVSVQSYPERYEQNYSKQKLTKHIPYNSTKRNLKLNFNEGDIFNSNSSNKRLTTESINRHREDKFNIDKDLFAIDSDFKADNFYNPPMINKYIGDGELNITKKLRGQNHKTPSSSGIFAASLKDHRISGVDRAELTRDEILFGSLKPRNMSLLKGELCIVSMSLYGSEAKYMTGAVENAKLVKTNFPGWKLRFYVESPLTKTPKYGQVPQHVLDKLNSLRADIHYILPEEDFLPPMMWRFLVADDPSVDRFVIRDSDSRLTKRDFSAVQAWMRSGQAFQCIRDHPSHSQQSVSGGLWGGDSHKLRIILRSSWIDSMRGLSSGYFTDMSFLQRLVWPKIVSHAYCSDSVSCDRWPNSFPFPNRRYGYDHVGEVYDERGIGRRVDIKILQRHGENENCLPPPDY